MADDSLPKEFARSLLMGIGMTLGTIIATLIAKAYFGSKAVEETPVVSLTALFLRRRR